VKDLSRLIVRTLSGGANEHCTFRVVYGHGEPELTWKNTVTVGRSWLFANHIMPEDLD